MKMRRFFKTFATIIEIAPGKRAWLIQQFLSDGLYYLSGLLPPIATSAIIGVLTDGTDISAIWWYAGLFILFYIIRFTFLAWNYHCYVVLSQYYYDTVQQLLFDHVANHDIILEKISRGKITDTCSEDVSYIVCAVDITADIFCGAIQLIVIFCIFATYSIPVALGALFIDALYIYIMIKNSHKVSRRYEGTRKYHDKIADILSQMLGSLRQVKSLNLMPNLTKKLEQNRKNYANEYNQKYVHLTNHYCTIPIIIYVGKIALYITLAYLVAGGSMNLDQMVLLISYFEMVISCTDELLKEYLDLDTYDVRIRRIKTILDYSSKTQQDFDGDIENDYINGVVVFDHVNFEKDSQQILKNVSFKASPNEITAIVGHPGAGKTTIINLLYRLYRVKSGSILIDDESIYNYSKKVYSSNVSGVFQKSFVFKMSIRDNLSLVNSNLNDQMDALQRVGLYDVIQRLPYGINTMIDNNDAVLTAGQLQKLAIARALLSRAEILLFDEVTSSIDPASSKEVVEILKDLKEDHTIIVITHKPEIMDIADQVVVLNNGKVSAKGKNSDVFEKSALYRELKTAIFAQPSVNDDLSTSASISGNSNPPFSSP